MILSASTGALLKHFDDKEIVDIFSSAGFDAYDCSLCQSMMKKDHPFAGKKYIKYAKELKQYADSKSLKCNQAHAPFPSSYGDPEKDEATFNLIVKSMEIASILGAKIIIVHPKQHLVYAENAEKLYHLNIEFYNRLIPFCEKFNIKVAVENMWQDNKASGAVTDSTCSRAFEFNKYIDTINSKWIVGCLDVGHVSLISNNIPKFISDMGKDHIKALHIHDTDFIHDSHTLPFIQKINFNEVAKALGQIGYDGDFTFEVNSYFYNFPASLIPSAVQLMHDVGRYLISEIISAQ